MLHNIGRTLLDQERHDEALPYLRRALAIREASVGDRHRLTAGTRVFVAQALSSAGAIVEATALLEQVLALDGQLEAGDSALAQARVVLAEVRWGQGRETESRLLMEEARSRFAKLGPPHASAVAQLDEWLREHSSAGYVVEGP